MKRLAIYLIIISSVVVFIGSCNLTAGNAKWDLFQVGVGIPYLILSIIFISSKDKYSDNNFVLAILVLILACITIVYDTLLRCAGFIVGESSISNVWVFIGVIAGFFLLLYIPAIVFSSIIIVRHNRHIEVIGSNTKAKEKEGIYKDGDK